MIKKGVFLFILLAVAIVVVSPASAYLSGYNYRLTVSVSGSSSGALTNYPVDVILHNTTGTNTNENIYLGSKVLQSDWDDVRFTKTDDTLLGFWIENTSASAAKYWVNVTSAPSEGTSIYMYYGNASVSSASNGTLVFSSFDDFNDGSISSIWTNTANCAESAGKLTVGSGGTGTIYTSTTYGTNYATRINCAFSAAGGGTTEVAGFFNSGLTSGVCTHATGVADQIRPANFNSGSSTFGSNLALYTTYYTYDDIRCSTVSHLNYVNDIGPQTLTANLNTGNLPMLFYGTASYPVVVDYALVRQCVSPEPYISDAGSEYSATIPNAAFSANVTYGTASLFVGFTDSTTNTPTAWNWSFGDGSYSTSQNPVHEYTGEGVYEVKLNASNSYGYDWENKTGYIYVVTSDDMSGYTLLGYHTLTGSGTWNSSQTNYNVKLNVYNITGTSSGNNIYLGNMLVQDDWGDLRFTSSSNHIYDMWFEFISPTSVSVWVQVDQIPIGGTSVMKIWGRNPSSDVSSDGNTTFMFFDHFDEVSLNSTNWESSGTIVYGEIPSMVTIGDDGLIKSKYLFGTNVSSTGYMNLEYDTLGSDYYEFGFYDYTSTKLAWLGSRIGGTAQYSGTTGTYGGPYENTELGGTSSEYNSNYYTNTITRNGSSSVDFVFGQTQNFYYPQQFAHDTQVPQEYMNLTYSGTGISGQAIDWVFVRPYVYPEPVHSSTVLVYPDAAFYQDIDGVNCSYADAIAPFTVAFHDISLGTVTSWYWDFGDGETSTDQSPTHYYDSVGVYDVKHRVMNANGTSWSNKTGMVGSIRIGDFPYAATLNLTNTAESSLTDYQMEFQLVNSTGSNTSNILYVGTGTTRDDWGDLLFIQDGDNCRYWIEETNSTTCRVWVKVPDILNDNSSRLSIYWGNATWESRSDGHDTWIFFDDFETGDFRYWNTTDSKLWSITGSSKHGEYAALCTVNNPDPIGATMEGSFDYSGNVIWRGYWMTNIHGSNSCAAEYLNAYLNISQTYDIRSFVSPLAGFNTGYRHWLGIGASWEDTGLDYTNSDWDRFQVAYNWSSGFQKVWIDYSGPYTNYANTSTVNPINSTMHMDSIRVAGSSNSGTNQLAYIDDEFVGKWSDPQPGYGAWLNGGVLPPIAIATANATSGTEPLYIQFTDYSTENPTSWAWDFNEDDSIDSTDQNPVALYSSSGIFDVHFKACNGYGCDWENGTITITVSSSGSEDPPVSSFSANVTGGVTPLWVGFTDSSTNAPTSWYWQFGDGDTSTDENPVHEYTTGTYSVNHSATNAYGTDWENKTSYITVNAPSPPIAAFSANDTTVYVNDVIQFTDASTNSPTSWFWLFGDSQDSHIQNPTHYYDTAGTYNVSLQATNGEGSDWENKTSYITVSETPLFTPVAGFSANATAGATPLSVLFTDSSTNTPTSWYWEFGDGDTSTDEDPSHVYTSDGTYSVNHSATNAGGTDWENKTSYITSYDPSDPIITLAATETTSIGATMNGVLVSGDLQTWFDYGISPSNMAFRTEPTNQTGYGNFSHVFEEGLSGLTYYYRAAHLGGHGATFTFTVGAFEPIPISTFKESYFDPLEDAHLDLWTMLSVGVTFFTDMLGGGTQGQQLLYGIFFLVVIMVLWLRHDSIYLAGMTAVLALASIGTGVAAGNLPIEVRGMVFFGGVALIMAAGYSMWKRGTK